MDIIELESAYCAPNYEPLPVVLTRGAGVWLWDERGRKYLDMMSAYSAVSHGHAHPRILRALQDQSSKLSVVSRAFYSDRLGIFLQKLCELTGLDGACPMNTGAEAVETAIKASRRWGYRIKGIAAGQAEIVVASGNFHGRTTTIVGFSDEASYRDAFGPFAPGFKRAEFGDSASFAAAINENTCAVLVEPIQGEAGIRVPASGWLRELREICTKQRVLLILDEIQSGLGRTGRWFAWQHESIQPDGVCLGKALGGGVLPVSAFVAKREVIQLLTPGSHGSTFGGNPLAAAVAYEALRVIEDENLVQRSAELGEHLRAMLRSLRSTSIVDIRGRGLWVGVEFDPKLVSAREVCEKLMQRGVLTKETHETVVRLAPPLVIERAEIEWAVEQFASVVRELESAAPAAGAAR